MNLGKQGRPKGGRWWILGGLATGLVLLSLAIGTLLPIWVAKWLGGKEFQRLASQQVSSLLQTQGDFEPFEWSSFSVYTGGFQSRPGAPGPCLWNIREIRTEISPRLLLDRILRFSEISIGKLSLQTGINASPVREAIPSNSSAAGPSAEIFRDVQIGKVEVRDFQIAPSAKTGGWGASGITAHVQPSKQTTTFSLAKGEIQTPLSWLGRVNLVEAKGRYVDPTIFLTSLSVKAQSGGTLEMSGEFVPGAVPQAKGRILWDRWTVPGGKIGVGLFEIPASMSGDFMLQEWRKGGPVGNGRVQLVDARLEPGRGSETILGILGLLTGEPRLRGCPLTTAKASWALQPGLYDVNQIIAEAPGLLRAVGQIQVRGESLSGRIELGLEGDLGRKVNALTGGECFDRLENGYSVQSIQLSGTLSSPKNDLEPKLKGALARTAIRTGAQILEKATGAQGSGDAAGQAVNVLKSLFGPAPK
jgi:hypothetical protein